MVWSLQKTRPRMGEGRRSSCRRGPTDQNRQGKLNQLDIFLCRK